MPDSWAVLDLLENPNSPGQDIGGFYYRNGGNKKGNMCNSDQDRSEARFNRRSLRDHLFSGVLIGLDRRIEFVTEYDPKDDHDQHQPKEGLWVLIEWFRTMRQSLVLLFHLCEILVPLDVRIRQLPSLPILIYYILLHDVLLIIVFNFLMVR